MPWHVRKNEDSKNEHSNDDRRAGGHRGADHLGWIDHRDWKWMKLVLKFRYNPYALY